MKWIKKNDTFVLVRHELVDLLVFNLAWMFEPAKKRPRGYRRFHKEILCQVDGLLREYMTEKNWMKKLKRKLKKK